MVPVVNASGDVTGVVTEGNMTAKVRLGEQEGREERWAA